MSAKTTIEWTDRTWNPVTGCTKISPGCAHCYAERITERFQGAGSFDVIRLHMDRLEEPLHWRAPQHVFVNSMSDLFHEEIPDEFILRVFATMQACPHLKFQILTKRAERMSSFINHAEDEVCRAGENLAAENGWCHAHEDGPWPLKNVWLGVSVENQRFADERIPVLLETPAALRFISAEPLLDKIDLRTWLKAWTEDEAPMEWRHPSLNWVICGGESGPGARPMDRDWVRSLRDQCAGAGVPFFFKQWGGSNKKITGRELDGLEWSQFPHARHGAA